MLIRDEVLQAAAMALSDAARGENIYLPFAKARRMIEPALEAAVTIARQHGGSPRMESVRSLVRNKADHH
ncbi:hypothetical protein ACFB49_11470 [Sphingomonas sp. DBB INV C78]|uniref:hypothetical protein n=1 Tax=Sphingomonas sp. DBB INV C78 TaxID=3349434 RepID=UPI0036D3562F